MHSRSSAEGGRNAPSACVMQLLALLTLVEPCRGPGRLQARDAPNKRRQHLLLMVTRPMASLVKP
eukprot:6490508-Amphidinium_carterae.3